MPAPIQTLILAAGEAKRMGKPKQLLPYKKQTFLGRAISLVNELPIGKPLVVLGYQADIIRKELKNPDADIVVNQDWQEGMGNTLAYGLQSALEYRGELQAILVLLADQPRIQKSHLLRLIKAYEQEKCPIVATEYPNGGGVPAIFDKSVFSDLLKLTGDKGARDLIRSQTATITVIPQQGEVWDIDTPGDYRKLLDS